MKNKYQTLEISIISFLIIRSSIILGIFDYLISNTKEDSILSVIFGSILGLIIVLMFTYINNYRPNLNILEKINNEFNPIISTIIKSILLASITILSFYLLNKIASYINYNLLYSANKNLISITFIVLSIYLTQKGLRTIIRTSDIIINISFIFIIISMILLIPHFDIDNLKPIYTSNNYNIFISSIIYSIVTASPLLLVSTIKKDKIYYNKHYYKTAIITYLISNLIILINLILTIGILGIKLANFYNYSYLKIFSKISFFNFIERIETLLSITYLFDGLILLSMMFTFIKKIIKYNKKNITDYLLYLFAIIIFIGSNHSNILSINVYFYILLISFIFIPLILVIKILIKR